MESISEKLIKLRKEKGISQEELAKDLFVSRQAVSKWETNTFFAKGVIHVESIVRLFKK